MMVNKHRPWRRPGAQLLLALTLGILSLSAQGQSPEALPLLAGQAPAGGLPSQLDAATWKIYSQAVQRNWQQYRSEIGEPMQAWADREVPAFSDTVFYPFSGPDFSTVSQLFPKAKRYILVAMQAAERPIHLAELKPKAARQTLEVLTEAWGKYGQSGFFVTEYLDKYLHTNQVRIGASTFLSTFFQLKGLTVSSMVPIAVNAQGEIEELDPRESSWRSVRFRLNRAGETVVVDYLRIDLSDKGLSSQPGHEKFVEQASAHPALLKAASHLPQNKGFSIIARNLVDRSPFIIQDETGIRYNQLQEKYSLTLFGKLERTHSAFGGYQRDLVKAFSENNDIRPLAFRVGYFKGGSYALILARRKG
jgi:hypothetical protein